MNRQPNESKPLRSYIVEQSYVGTKSMQIYARTAAEAREKVLNGDTGDGGLDDFQEPRGIRSVKWER